MVPKLVKLVVIKTLLDVILKYIKRYGVKAFMEHLIKVVKMLKNDPKMEKLAEDLQVALDNYVN